MKHFACTRIFTCITLVILVCCSLSLPAQLLANFTADKTGGCSPLNVRFTNTTTGASSAATWAWSFGNGNTSTLRDPGATYITAQTYTVTLTVRDGASTSSKTLTISVYKNPVVDFTAAPARGCVPLTVNFTSTATAGDGTIANYLWDFGDGGTVQGAGYSSTSHPYTFPQTPPVTLNVTNSYGCYTTLTKLNQVEAVSSVVAAFNPSVLTLCRAGESIIFNNTSTGSGTLTYRWDFGDGSPTSTDQTPVHVYATPGSFITKLVVTSSDGCSATVQSAAINVANFKADFTVPPIICFGQQAFFTNTSTQPFDRVEWYIDNSQYYTYSNNNLNTVFSVTGTHTIRLVAHYGNCIADTTKTITVNEVPVLAGFLSQLNGACGVPVTVQFSDTCSTAVAWEWKHYYNGTVFGTSQNASANYTTGSDDYVSLTVRNAAGCSTTVNKYINYDRPLVYIRVTNTNNIQGCTGLTLSFAASPDTSISTYQWNFGDGTATSILPTPTHTFNIGGNYTVSLNFTTNSGCRGVAYYSNINVVSKPNFDFNVSPGTTICGNSPVTFTVTPATATTWNYYWAFNDTLEYSSYYSNSIVKKFNWDTVYTVKLIAINGFCRDTVTKINYITVKPPFPRIDQAINTCDGTRGAVRFTESSLKALQWSWNFGDGGTDNYSFFKDTIRHTYTGTGSYNVVLSTTNGACTVRDSIQAYVLLKQQPVLAVTQTNACQSDFVNFTLNGYQVNPSPYYSSYYGYYVSEKQYGDLTPCNAPITSGSNYFTTQLTGSIQSLEPGKNDLRMMTTSGFFGCVDTSNFVPLRIHGPAAGFKVLPHSGCFKDPVAFSDTSHPFGSTAIVKWEWDFGDNRTQTLTAGGSTTHLYNAPGYYYVRLKITDADGCTSATDYYTHYITVAGPKADFNASSFTVPVNSTVNFYNNSAFYNTYPYYSACSLKWIFSDGTTSFAENTSFYFTLQGNYPVTLITYNSQTGCTDTIQKTIAVRKVNSAFTVVLSYINSNSCPPVIATFTSISTNAARVSWSFGDGGIAGNQRIVSHTYNSPGIYRVVHYSFDTNNAVDSTEDYIEVKGPYALLKADTLYACNTLQVRLTADVRNASEYTWDFGDGTVVPTTDTFAIHDYLTPGIYIPALILRDISGCTATSMLPDKIIVDSLAASFTITPDTICDAALSRYIPQVISLSNAALQAPLKYTWISNEQNLHDTAYTEQASHFFSFIGTHNVNLTVQSPFGCRQDISKTVVVKAGVTATITGADTICQGSSTSFAGSAIPASASLLWRWDFGNGNISSLQNPLPQTYNTAGLKQVTLIVNNGGCTDTAYHPLMVNPNPVVSFTPANPYVCLGSNTQITASGGLSYQWSSTGALQNAASPTAIVNPVASVFYFVKVTDAIGCSKRDSVFVKVIQPLHLVTPQSLFVCQGNALQLNVAGADTYKWINNTAGISNLTIANPSARPASSVTYTVVGYDMYNCFTDTANIAVRISVPPLVNAGADATIVAGSAITLAANVSGAVNWAWSPADYLSCTNCLNPVSKPKATTTYTLSAYNADGCMASGKVTLQLLCKNDLVFIPKAFSPNGDLNNERFYITGSGVKSIRSIIVYNRWGKVMFERKNISPGDRSNSWDGTYNGEPMPAGTYVYWISTECDGGDVFNYRGTVLLLR